MRTILIAVFCSFLIVGVVFAQSDRGTITGTIADPAGAVIPNASIEVKNSETGAVYQAASTATGNYTLAQLPAGVYQLAVSMSGFKQYIRTGITVPVAQTLRIDIQLEVGNISETVTVSADAPLLKTESGEMSHNVSTDRLDDLPILNTAAGLRNPYAVTQLIAGTTFIPNAVVRVNSSPGNTQSLRIEGQDATNGLWSTTQGMTQPGVDSIEEFAIQTSNFAAEFGQAGGGLFNVTMRSGTNQLHGSAYEYLVNEAFNARQPFLNVKPRSRRHDYGFTLGGPVYIPKVYNGHDKTFFFFSFEQNRLNNTGNFASNYPYGIGPRIGLAYQITPKTVFRAGWGISYGQTAQNNFWSLRFGSRVAYSSPSFGAPAMVFKDGVPKLIQPDLQEQSNSVQCRTDADIQRGRQTNFRLRVYRHRKRASSTAKRPACCAIPVLGACPELETPASHPRFQSTPGCEAV